MVRCDLECDLNADCQRNLFPAVIPAVFDSHNQICHWDFLIDDWLPDDLFMSLSLKFTVIKLRNRNKPGHLWRDFDTIFYPTGDRSCQISPRISRVISAPRIGMLRNTRSGMLRYTQSAFKNKSKVLQP